MSAICRLIRYFVIRVARFCRSMITNLLRNLRLAYSVLDHRFVLADKDLQPVIENLHILRALELTRPSIAPKDREKLRIA